jgi:dTDP-4-amino-4,6-dideoxygalactose transaminase
MIPVFDLKAQYAAIEQEIDAAIKEVLLSGQFILGPAVRDLEERAAAYCGCKYGVGVASGTDALRLTLTALGVGPEDEVITTPFTFIATANTMPYESPDAYHVYHQYTIRAEQGDALAAYLKERGIGTMIYYPVPLHLQGLYVSLGYGENSLPESEKVSREVLSLPMYPELTEAQQIAVAEAIRGFYER